MTDFFLRDFFVIGAANFCLLFPHSHILFSKVEKDNSTKARLLGIKNKTKLKTILSCGNTAKSSRGSYWSASTIKILPAIAVLRKGINPKTHVRMKRYRGNVRQLLRLALTVSSNKAYDSLVDLVGLDYVNTTAKQLGLKHTWLTRAYGRRGSLRFSAGYWLGKKYIPPKWAKLKNSKCRANCTSFKDLQKLMLHATRYKELRRWTIRSRKRNKLAKVVKRFYPKAKLYCKGGYVAYHYGLTNCRLGKYFITIGIPCKSWKSWWRNNKKQVRIAEIVLFCYRGKKF